MKIPEARAIKKRYTPVGHWFRARPGHTLQGAVAVLQLLTALHLEAGGRFRCCAWGIGALGPRLFDVLFGQSL